MVGKFDRPWFPRPIFGTVRYMARSGAEKKFDTEKYIAQMYALAGETGGKMRSADVVLGAASDSRPAPGSNALLSMTTEKVAVSSDVLTLTAKPFRRRSRTPST